MAQYTKVELTKKTIGDLRTLADQHDLEFEEEKPNKAALIAALLDVEDSDIEDEEEVEPELEDEEDDIELPAEDEEEELPDEEELDEEPAPAAKKPRAKKTTEAKPEASGDTLVAKQVATILGTEAKVLRQFFRSDSSTIEPVGAGGRYEFNKSDIDKIKSEFETWRAGHASRGTTRGKAKADKPAEKFEEVEEAEGIEELDSDEVSDDDLELEEED